MEVVKRALLRLLLTLIYCVSHVYDYISYPIYFLVQKAWRVRKYRKRVHADTRPDPDDPQAVIYTSKAEQVPMSKTLSHLGLSTLKSVLDYVCDHHSSNQALGTRTVLSVEDEVQPNNKVFQKYVLGDYTWRTYTDMRMEAMSLARGLVLNVGLKANTKLAILAETRAEWIITAYACFMNSVSVVTLYTNLGVDGIAHAVEETEVGILVATVSTLPKVKEVLAKCPKLKTVLLMPALIPGERAEANKLIKEMSDTVEVKHLEDISSNNSHQTVKLTEPKAEDCAILMYTSGSTGLPKGVILSHSNLVASLKSLINCAPLKASDKYLAFLPLAHVLELLAETACMTLGMKIAYSSPNTLTNKSSKVKAGCKGDANLFRPTLMCAVPLILERIYKSVVDTMRRQGWAVEELFHYLVNYKIKWQDRGFDTPLLNKTLFRKIRYFLGGRVRIMLSGGAPLSHETHSLTRTCICVPLIQGYGLTETSACATITSVRDRKTCRVGAPLFNVEIKLVNWEEGNYRTSDKPHPRGEIHIGGDNVAMGYYKTDAKTQEDFYTDSEGKRWFKTGDIGEVHDDGVVKIIDRRKDLVKLQTGEYISYGRIESILKTCPIVDNICVHAESDKSYAIGVVVPDKTVLSEITSLTLEEAVKDSQVIEKIVKSISEFGFKNKLNKFELPQKIVLTLDEWTPETGLVTAAMKIRRRFIVAKYKEQIQAIYK